METTSVSDLVATYSKFTQEAIEEYAKKYKVSSISAEDLKLLNQHVATYCLDKMTEQLLQVKELNNEVRPGILERKEEFEQEKCLEPAPIHQSTTGPSEVKELNNEVRPGILEKKKEFEQEKCLEPAPIHQSSTGPSEVLVKELNNKAEVRQDILEEEIEFEQEKCLEPALIHQSSTGPSEIYVNLFMKLMTDHQKQQQEYQNTVLKTFLDQLKHQHTQEEQSQQQQNRFHEQVLQQQQDFQTRLMADFMKHSEMQTTLLFQILSEREQRHHDDHINVDIKDTPCHESCSQEETKNFNEYDNYFPGRVSAKQKMESCSHFQDTPRHESCSQEKTKHFNEGDNSFPDTVSAKTMESCSHFQVSKAEKQPFQLFDCHKLGQDFCNWFFPILNSQNPEYGQERLAWSPQMFFNDATICFTYENSFESYTGDECVSSKLLEMVQKEKLTFTPKLDSKRFKCVNSRHGLVVVAVTGIISQSGKCSMVFNQIFGLIKCPSTGNYKIKSMNLKVDNMNPLSSVQKFHVPPLQYTTEQLQDFNI